MTEGNAFVQMLMPPEHLDANGTPSSRERRDPPVSSRPVTPRTRDASSLETMDSNPGGNWERLNTVDTVDLMSPQATAVSNRPPSADSPKGSQTARTTEKEPVTPNRSNQWEHMSLASAPSPRSPKSAEKTRPKRADTPQPRQGVPPTKRSQYRWTGEHDEAKINCKCPVCAPMNIAANRVAGLHSGAIMLTLSDKLNLTEKPELGEEAPSKPELTAGDKRRPTEVGALMKYQHDTSKTTTKTKGVTGGNSWGHVPNARKTEVGEHLILAGNEPKPEDADKFEFHLQFKDFKRKKKGYFSRPSHTGVSLQGQTWRERSHLNSADTRCQAEKELGWNPNPRGGNRETYLAAALPPYVASDVSFTPRSARSRSSSVHSARGALKRSLSERDLPLSARMSGPSSARGEHGRIPREYMIPQVPDKPIGAKFEAVPQEHLYNDQRRDADSHFHMSKPTREIRRSAFEGGAGMKYYDFRSPRNKQPSTGIDASDLVCDSYQFEEGMPWMYSKSEGGGEKDYIAKRRLRKWGEFSHGPSMKYVVLEERAKPLYRYHRAVSAPPGVSGDHHTASLLGSIPVLGGDKGRCKCSWESWRPAKKSGENNQHSSHDIAVVISNAEIHDYSKNFKKRVKQDPKFAQVCKDTAQIHKDNMRRKAELRTRWQTTSIGALLHPDSHK